MIYRSRRGALNNAMPAETEVAVRLERRPALAPPETTQPWRRSAKVTRGESAD
jgi:hypothetical protein